MPQQPVSPIIQQHLPEILNLMTLLDQELINDPDSVYHKNAPILYDIFNFLMFILPNKDVTTENYKYYIELFLKGTEEEYIPLSQKPIPPKESFEQFIKNFIKDIKCEVYPEHMYIFQIALKDKVNEVDLKKAYSQITGKSWESDIDIEEMNKEIAKIRTFHGEELIKSIILKKPTINKSAYNLHLLQYRYDIEAKPDTSISEIINTYKSLKVRDAQVAPKASPKDDKTEYIKRKLINKDYDIIIEVNTLEKVNSILEGGFKTDIKNATIKSMATAPVTFKQKIANKLDCNNIIYASLDLFKFNVPIHHYGKYVMVLDKEKLFNEEKVKAIFAYHYDTWNGFEGEDTNINNNSLYNKYENDKFDLKKSTDFDRFLTLYQSSVSESKYTDFANILSTIQTSLHNRDDLISALKPFYRTSSTKPENIKTSALQSELASQFAPELLICLTNDVLESTFIEKIVFPKSEEESTKHIKTDKIILYYDDLEINKETI